MIGLNHSLFICIFYFHFFISLFYLFYEFHHVHVKAKKLLLPDRSTFAYFIPRRVLDDLEAFPSFEEAIEKGYLVKQEIKDIVKNHGELKLGEITVAQVYQGMRGMVGMVTETSRLDPEEGIRFRGYSIPELRKQLPKAPGGTEPLPEGIFYLMLMNELPTDSNVLDVSNNWARRSNVPKHVFDMLDALPKSTHPMTQFSAAILALQTESVFTAAYRKGLNKKEYWVLIFNYWKFTKITKNIQKLIIDDDILRIIINKKIISHHWFYYITITIL
mgnify:CR=1 FL=1